MSPRAPILVSLLTLGALLAPAAPAQPPAEPAVTLAAGADLRAAVEALGAATGGVVVADATPAKLTLSRPLDHAPLPEAVAQICATFDCWWVHRGNLLVLQNRGSLPEEGPGLEVEEIRATFLDMYRLIDPFVPPIDEVGETRSQDGFAHSLTPEQQQQMMARDGLPVASLPKQQRASWIALCRAHRYLNDRRELRRGALCMQAWPHVTLVNLPLTDPTFPTTPSVTDLAVHFPDAADVDGHGTVQLRVASLLTHPRRSGGPGEDVPPTTAPAPASLQVSWKLAAQRMRPSDLSRELSGSGGPTLETPAYAKDRAFYITSAGSRYDVLQALSVLWGWDLTVHEGGYRLRRPQFGQARDVLDLENKLHALVPPYLWNQLRARWEGASDPENARMLEVLKASDKTAGRGWKQIRVDQLDAMDQRRLANAVATWQLSTWYAIAGKQSKAPYWLAFPEKGSLHLSGPVGPEQHPTLTVLIREPGSDSVTGWGWGVDSDQTIVSPRRR